MKGIDVSNVLRVLVMFLTKMKSKDVNYVTIALYELELPNWEEKRNYREDSVKEKTEKALMYLVKNGYIIQNSKYEYAYYGSIAMLKETIQNFQQKQLYKSMSEKASMSIEATSKLDNLVLSNSLLSAIEGDNDDDDDDDDLFSDDDDDGDIKDLHDIISECVNENKPDLKNVEQVDETTVESSFESKLDKLLEEMELQFSEIEEEDDRKKWTPNAKTTEEAKIYVARLCKTRREAKKMSLKMQHEVDSGEKSYLTVVAFLRAFAEFDRLSEKAYRAYRKSIPSV